MMLSSAMPAGTAERCSALGLAGWLSKPITQSELLDAILIAVSRDAEDGHSPEADTQIAESGAARSGLRILVAEDNLINRAVATGILEKAGHVLVHATTGREAVEAFSDGCFYLILMDVQMPEMDGFEATRRIRELEETTGGHIRIVAMTAHAMAGDRADAIEKRDAPALAVSAHKLLSSLGAFGAKEAGSLALRLERHGQESDFGGAKERYTQLERETHKIYTALA